MKLSELKVAVAKDEEGVVVPIVGKDGEEYTALDGSPVTITVVGAEAKRIRDARTVQTKRVLRQQRTRLDVEDLRTNRIELAAAGVIAWHGWEDDNDQPIACTPENVKAVLAAAEHVLDQVEQGIQRHAAFFGPSSTS